MWSGHSTPLFEFVKCFLASQTESLTRSECKKLFSNCRCTIFSTFDVQLVNHAVGVWALRLRARLGTKGGIWESEWTGLGQPDRCAFTTVFSLAWCWSPYYTPCSKLSLEKTMFVPNMQFYRPCPQMFFNFQTARFINVFFLINCPAIRYTVCIELLACMWFLFRTRTMKKMIGECFTRVLMRGIYPLLYAVMRTTLQNC